MISAGFVFHYRTIYNICVEPRPRCVNSGNKVNVYELKYIQDVIRLHSSDSATTIIISPQGNIKHLWPPSLLSLMTDPGNIWPPASCFISLCLSSQDWWLHIRPSIHYSRSHLSLMRCTFSTEISIKMNFNIIIETGGASSSTAYFDYSELVLPLDIVDIWV